MGTIFRYSLTRMRGQIIGWGIPMALWALLVMSLYDVVAKQQAEFEQLLKNYPPEFSAFFGDVTKIATPNGFLSLEYFTLMPILLGIFALLAGSGLLASDEENGTLDLVLAYPVKRMALFAGRLLAFVVSALAILAIGWLALIVAMNFSTLKIGWNEMALPFVSLFGVLMLYGTLALLLSMVLPARRLAAMTSGVLLVAGYLITSLARVNKALEPIARLSPLNYYQGGDAILGLKGEWVAGLLVVSALFVLAAAVRFQRRDIRVGGEGGWGFVWRRRAAA
ncbi:MAG: ABC transporter permease subunit [Chloroflexi bacterium]|nr:ABC transporter permease subunit [Chloroflexota bacterium]